MYVVDPFLAICDVSGGGEGIGDDEHGFNEVIGDVPSVVEFVGSINVDEVEGDMWGWRVEEGDEVEGGGASILYFHLEEALQSVVYESKFMGVLQHVVEHICDCLCEASPLPSWEGVVEPVSGGIELLSANGQHGGGVSGGGRGYSRGRGWHGFDRGYGDRGSVGPRCSHG